MTAMLAHLLLLAATLASPTADRRTSDAYAGARAEGRVAVRIVAGARIAASEIQQEEVPPLQDSHVRSPNGDTSPARLVEFQ